MIWNYVENVKRLFIKELRDFLWIFKYFLKIFVMFLNVDVCDVVVMSLLQLRVLTMSSLKLWCEVLKIVLGCMHMPADTSGA